ncbi:MAG: alpha-hydroxy-acid oxidizing protein [Gammaproteobacteria bacterium]|nr:alpha-hydroxy-acid oxidizing protein [Gammaproteobacteria bacterium]MBV9724032.1 alpha-hydroxy-acid oxidizing protein [Gammaproteobacteria bacterium]
MPWKRRAFASRNLTRALNIADLRDLARRSVPGFVFEYVESGAEDEMTISGNREALRRLRLLPQTLVNTSGRQLRSTILGRPANAPLVIAPTGLNGLLHRDGDVILARAAAQLGIPYTLSTVSTTLLEEVASRAGGRLWMQLYVVKERAVPREIMRRAAAAGYEALVFTTDANVFGNREWDQRGYRAPGKPTLRASLDALRHPRWLWEVLLRHGLPRFRNLEPFVPANLTPMGASTVIPRLFDATIDWNDIGWIREHWPGKLLLKGVLSAADAERAAALGADGIVVSNHGGRQLDYCVAPIEVLPEIKAAAGGRLAVLIDGGFRRGTDVVKALALGAEAVLLGRATLYGLIAGGARGVDRALAILTSEIDRVLGQLGCNSIAELTPGHVRGA